jgi:hypothetical protein
MGRGSSEVHAMSMWVSTARTMACSWAVKGGRSRRRRLRSLVGPPRRGTTSPLNTVDVGLVCSYARETLQRDAERKLSDGSKFDAARCKSVTIS